MNTENTDQALAFLREHARLLASALSLYEERMNGNAEEMRAEQARAWQHFGGQLEQVAADFETQANSAAKAAAELETVLDATLWAEARDAGNSPYLNFDEHGFFVAIDHPDHGELEGQHRYSTEEGAAAALLKIEREVAGR